MIRLGKSIQFIGLTGNMVVLYQLEEFCIEAFIKRN